MDHNWLGAVGTLNNHALYKGVVHAGVPAPPLVEHGRTAAVLPGQIRNGNADLVPLKEGHDPAVGES